MIPDDRNGRLWPHRRAEGWTYFIQVVAAEGPVKIGRAISITERFRALQGANYLPLRFLGALPYDEVPERELHRIFGAWHLRGEWFHVNELIYNLADSAHRHFKDGFKDVRGRRAPELRHIALNIKTGSKMTEGDISAYLNGYDGPPSDRQHIVNAANNRTFTANLGLTDA